MTRPALAGLLALLLAACAASEPPRTAAAEEPAALAETVAALLAGAEADAGAGRTSALARRVARLEALGARPAQDAGEDPVAAWRASTGSEAIPFRGRALGPAYRRGTLAADSELELTQTFLSGRRAVIAVSSPAGNAPALRVVSASGTTVCESAARCRWTPVFTERYAITLRNTSRQARAYYLVVE
ncbi:hypothetical protein U4960_04380 [Altererythrobacter sp. H2]|uniref:hypothetical protein n=1 Tax=Altererythrobacter sp. H2 TaxID=3108391 RepID=UPI002B4C14A9|nr:hypothetical protein [Altererythrobacter sp. H2]WRK96566.1 hypothetical protein U4960_04380 [Altererythrobacter sp. H2]